MANTLEKKILLGILALLFITSLFILPWLSAKEDYDTSCGIYLKSTDKWIKGVEYALGVQVFLFLTILQL